jgi:hypothetical protein
MDSKAKEQRSPARWVAVAAIAAGAAMVAYGAAVNSTPVLVEQRIEAPPSPFGGQDVYGGFGGPDTPATPIMELVTVEMGEGDVVFDVTVGGLERVASGELKRTYSGAPPAACPT